MRELEFLPPWYQQLQRRRRWVRLEAWVTGILLTGLALALFLVDRNHDRGARDLTAVLADLKQTDGQLREMDRLLELQKQWRHQYQILAKLGMHVEGYRLIGTLASIMPNNMSLTSMGFETEETPQPLGQLARASYRDPADAPMDRRLKVELCGVAPTDVDLATFITELNQVPFFDRVAMAYARDKREGGHTLREFKLTFSVNLNMPGR